jgi:hypothetical protein
MTCPPCTHDCEQGKTCPAKSKDEIKFGDIVQVSPDKEMFGACMVVVTEVMSWGIQGYVQSAGVEGQQYIRLANDDFESTGGKAVWVVGEQA